MWVQSEIYEDPHPIRILNRRQPMRNCDRGPACSCFVKRFLYNFL